MRRSLAVALFACVLVAVVVVVIIAGDSGDDEEAASTGGGSATLRFMGYAEHQQVTGPMIERWNEANPDVQIEPTYIPFGQYAQTLSTQFQSGSAPDIMQVQAGASSLESVWNLGRGKLLSLADQPWAERVPDFVAEYLSVDGKLLAFPATMQPTAFFYNKKLFGELGLEPPTRFSDLLAACTKIKDAGKTPIAMGLQGIPAVLNLSGQAVAANVWSVDPDWSKKRENDDVTFASSPLWRKAFESLVKMKDAGCFPQGFEGVTLPQVVSTFARGQAAMTVAASGQSAAYLDVNPDLELGMFAPPNEDGSDQAVTVSAAHDFAVNAATKEPELAKSVVDFFASPEQNAEFAEANESLATVEYGNGDYPALLEDLVPLFESDRAVVGGQTGWRPQMSEAVIGQTVGMFTGQVTVDDALKAYDSTWDEAAAKDKG